jgi:hypothetical protein
MEEALGVKTSLQGLVLLEAVGARLMLNSMVRYASSEVRELCKATDESSVWIAEIWEVNEIKLGT